MKSIRYTTLIILLVVSFAPNLVMAQMVSDLSQERRGALILQINLLKAEVLRLQSLIDKKSLEVIKDESPYVFSLQEKPHDPTKYNFTYENIYNVKNTELVNYDSNRSVSQIDRFLFDLFTEIVGETAVDSKIKEFRIFNDSNAEVDAFIEKINGTDKWLLAVNRYKFELGDSRVLRSFAQLFVHEYAHILLYEEPEFEQIFINDFWTSDDDRHKEKIKKLDDFSRFKTAEEYFEKNRNRFVSDYATLNEVEDITESFLYFVLEEMPRGDSVKDQKIRSFYKVPNFIISRAEIRSRLNKLGVLQ